MPREKKDVKEVFISTSGSRCTKGKIKPRNVNDLTVTIVCGEIEKAKSVVVHFCLISSTPKYE